MLRCTKCDRDLEPEKFFKSSRNKTGRYSSCKECCKSLHKANSDKYKKHKISWAEKNPDYHKKYYLNNKDRLGRRNSRYGAWYRKTDKGRSVKKANSAHRRARLKKATPPWADLDKIKLIYLNCPKGFHVDHIIPLNSDRVCGLHVKDNLQYLEAKINLLKSNSFKGD